MTAFSPYQKFVVGILAFLQFTIVLDFMIILPLGAVIMPDLQITPKQFGIIVSAYAFSAGVSALLSASFADRFDRKKMLLFFYTGFIFGTLLCGLAGSFEFLLGARIITGIFGGVIASIVLAISTDLFPLAMRGRVVSVLQTSYATSQVIGIPAGLFITNKWGWHAPFFMIVTMALIAGATIAIKLQPINQHLRLQRDRNPLKRLVQTLLNSRYTLAFGLTALLTTGAFMLMPFGSAFIVRNLGVTQEDLPFVYLVTGVAMIFAGPLIGRAADALGKFPIFALGAILSWMTVLYYTQMGIAPLALVLAINTLLFISGFSRMIPAQALISAIPEPASRGSFMAVSSSLQQVSGGVASIVAGLILSEAPNGKIVHFNVLGYIVCCTIAATLVMMYFVDRKVPQQLSR